MFYLNNKAKKLLRSSFFENFPARDQKWPKSGQTRKEVSRKTVLRTIEAQIGPKQKKNYKGKSLRPVALVREVYHLREC